MAFTNSTTNYHLPQYIASDVPSYLVDQNDAWEIIDTALGSLDENIQETTQVANSASVTANEANAKALTADTKANGAFNNIGDAFSTSRTYAVGDYVIYNNVLYRCISAVNVAGEFQGSKWTPEKVSAVMKTVHNREFKVGDVFNAGNMFGFASSNSYATMSIVLPFPISGDVTNVRINASNLRGNGVNIADFTVDEVSIPDNAMRTRVSCHANASLTRYQNYVLGGCTLYFE